MLVSIFIPTYNASRCIDKTLESVLSQTHRDIEVWLVDDVSTDDTILKIRRWTEKDARVHLLEKEKNDGFVPYSWNRVFPYLQGEFTLYMSHDDHLSPDCIALLVSAQKETGADAVIPDCVFVYEDGRAESSSVAYRAERIIGPKQAFAEMLNYDIPGFALWRTSLIRQVGMSTEAWNSDEGMQRIWALHSRNGVALCQDAKFYYLLTNASITKGLKSYHLTGLKTQKRLLRAALGFGMPFRYPKAFFRFVTLYLRSYIYFSRVKLCAK